MQRWAVRPRDLHRAMLDINPQIVHFSGHGAGEKGLIFEDEVGQPKFLSGSALAGLFELFSDQLECVVLNGCYSLEQAQFIAQTIPYVVGMEKEIGDKAAISFSVGFYDAIGAGRTIDFAYKLGCSAIQLEGVPEHLTPVLTRNVKPDSEETKEFTQPISDLTVQALKAGSNITIQEFVANQATLAQQLPFFAQQIGLDSPRRDYGKSQYEAYSSTWKSLQALRLAGDDLWEGATDDNLVNFANQLRVVMQIVYEGELYFEEKDLDHLTKVLNALSSFYLGKERLIEIRSKKQIQKLISHFGEEFVESKIATYINKNHQYKLEYEGILEAIRKSFREKLSS